MAKNSTMKFLESLQEFKVLR